MMNDEFVSIKLCHMEISRNLNGGTEKNEEILQSRFTISRVPKAININNTIGLRVIIIYSGFKVCRNSLAQFTGTCDCQRIFHYEFISEGKIVNKEMYK